MLRASFSLALGVWALVGCGPSAQGTEGTIEEEPAEETAGEEHPVARTPRDLSREGTFSDLVAGARRQDELRDQDSSAGCLLRRTDAGYRLDADLAVALRPLPAPEADLDARMASDAPVRVLTRYGAYGESTEFGLVALTTTAPPRGSAETAVGLVIVLTDRGAYARRTDAPFGAVTPRPIDELVGTLPYAEVSTTFVAAEAGISLSALFAALALLPSTLAGHVALAVVLERGVTLPDRPTLLEEEGAPLCTELPASSEPESDALGGAEIREGLARLSGSVAICVGATTGPGARGGRMELLARIVSGGTVGDACIRADDTEDAHLRACVLRAARALTFPDPHGQVVFAVPLVLAPGTAHHQRATCD